MPPGPRVPAVSACHMPPGAEGLRLPCQTRRMASGCQGIALRLRTLHRSAKGRLARVSCTQGQCPERVCASPSRDTAETRTFPRPAFQPSQFSPGAGIEQCARLRTSALPGERHTHAPPPRAARAQACHMPPGAEGLRLRTCSPRLRGVSCATGGQQPNSALRTPESREQRTLTRTVERNARQSGSMGTLNTCLGSPQRSDDCRLPRPRRPTRHSRHRWVHPSGAMIADYRGRGPSYPQQGCLPCHRNARVSLDSASVVVYHWGGAIRIGVSGAAAWRSPGHRPERNASAFLRRTARKAKAFRSVRRVRVSHEETRTRARPTSQRDAMCRLAMCTNIFRQLLAACARMCARPALFQASETRTFAPVHLAQCWLAHLTAAPAAACELPTCAEDRRRAHSHSAAPGPVLAWLFGDRRARKCARLRKPKPRGRETHSEARTLLADAAPDRNRRGVRH